MSIFVVFSFFFFFFFWGGGGGVLHMKVYKLCSMHNYINSIINRQVVLKDTDQPVASVSSQMQSSTTSHWTLVRSFKKMERTTGYLGIPHMATSEAPMTENWDDDNDIPSLNTACIRRQRYFAPCSRNTDCSCCHCRLPGYSPDS